MMRNLLGIALAGLLVVGVAGSAGAVSFTYVGTLTLGLSTHEAPFWSRPSVFDLTTSYTVTENPASIKLLHIGAPIVPVPIQPIFVLPGSINRVAIFASLNLGLRGFPTPERHLQKRWTAHRDGTGRGLLISLGRKAHGEVHLIFFDH